MSAAHRVCAPSETGPSRGSPAAARRAAGAAWRSFPSREPRSHPQTTRGSRAPRARRRSARCQARAHARSSPLPAAWSERSRVHGRAGPWPRRRSPRRSRASTPPPRPAAPAGSRTPPGAAASVVSAARAGAPAAPRPQPPDPRRRPAPAQRRHSVSPEPRQSSLARACAARRCRWPGAADPARPSHACSGARGRPAAHMKPPGCPPPLPPGR